MNQLTVTFNQFEYFFSFCSAKVFEEEDYDARGYGYELKPDLTVVKSCFMLKEAEEELIKKAKNESNEVPEVCYYLNLAHFSRMTHFFFRYSVVRTFKRSHID